MPKAKILRGDCRAVMRTLAPDSVHAIVTDPPAGIAFMGADWDRDKGGRDEWIAWMQGVAEEAMRVLRPGGHALVWALPRTSHWTATAWENAGFEVRDRVAHVFGSGFPKSLDVAKGIDKLKDWSLVERLSEEIKRAREQSGLSLKQIGAATLAATQGQYGSWYHRGGHMFFETGRSLPSRPEWEQLRLVLPIRPEFISVYEEAEREIVGRNDRPQGWFTAQDGHDITAPATDAAREWQGWGTALKPALEDWWLLRKPLSEKTVAGNVLRHGTGALNIDACRVETLTRATGGHSGRLGYMGGDKPGMERPTGARWPSHLIHDGSDEVVRAFPDRDVAAMGPSGGGLGFQGSEARYTRSRNQGSSGSAARFFQACPPDSRIAYFPKASRADRDAGLEGMPLKARNSYSGAESRVGKVRSDGAVQHAANTFSRNGHPCVKPTSLMRYLSRLICPPGGTVLDCFAGSGSTGRGAVLEGFDFIGVEQDPAFAAIARKRIAAAQREARTPALPPARRTRATTTPPPKRRPAQRSRIAA